MLFSVFFQNLKRLSLEIKLRNRLGRTMSEIHVHCIEENKKKYGDGERFKMNACVVKRLPLI